MKINRAAVALVIAFMTWSAETADGKPSHLPVQLHFTAEATSVENPVPIPENVLAIYEDGRDGSECTGKPEHFRRKDSAIVVHGIGNSFQYA